jgi:hypothetical protein
MKLLALYLALLPLEASATASFQDAFHAYVKVRQIEEKLAITAINSQLDPVDQASELKTLNASLTEARIAFHSVARSDQEELEPWEKQVLARLEKKKPAKKEAAALPFLSSAFPNAKKFSALEWLALQEWFGQETQEEFLRQIFPMRELARSTQSGNPSKIVWVLDPFRRLLNPAERIEKADLEKLGASVTPVEISSFASVENQAEELRHFLLSKSSEPFVLVSSGEASAVVNKMLDLYPALRGHEMVVGWVNVNGRLFGKKTENSGRKLASVSTRADQFENDALLGLKLLHLESLERQPPLGQGFPILNLISSDQKFRPAMNLREAIVAEGAVHTVKKGPAWKALRDALPLLGQEKN